MLRVATEGAGEQGPAGGWEAEATDREGGSEGCQGGGKEEGAKGGNKEEEGSTEAGEDVAAGDGETATRDGGEKTPRTAGSAEVSTAITHLWNIAPEKNLCV